ncbi:hypothetical protein IVB34_12215 [Bradyrhizobium sp. 2]|uniref:hypothetical protein n=1 Tax=Bradyrhizobium sp. 2 TaxID=190045 RepID=UPI001FF849C3|nr:hypothetical protein [Bradyrhizobium sp. 2]MCK1459121.1 hypothetical protein [Bradyrhizobium sp. 2]
MRQTPDELRERLCQKCGEPTKSEEALVDDQIWCHPCADHSRLSADKESAADTELYRLRDLIASHIACEADCQKMPTGCGCALTAARAVMNGGPKGAAVHEALEIAEDVLSRAPFSTAIWPNGMHPNRVSRRYAPHWHSRALSRDDRIDPGGG